jgi:glycosyltransferase involved in cell wall biosynthesis
LDGLNESNFEKTVNQYIEQQNNIWFETEKLGFFCVAMRKDLIAKIGYLDEKFGIGMFEDDDYCLRVRKTGLKLAIIEDCFVYHKGSVSFGKLTVQNYQQLFKKNRAYFRQKHSVDWSLTDIAFSYWEKINNDLLTYCKVNKDIPPEINRILVRLENFKHLLVQIHRAELLNTPSDTPAKVSHIAKRAMWHTRWFNFKRNVILGTTKEKIRYFNTISRSILRRLGVNQQSNLPKEVISHLLVMRGYLGNQKLLIFPATIDFNFMTQRPQQLANSFAEAGFLVVYGTLNHTVDNVEISEKYGNNLFLLNEQYFPLISHVFTPEESIYYCLWPNNIKHLPYLPYSFLLYDYMDELSLLDLPINILERNHSSILNKANLVTVSSSTLMEKIPNEIKSKSLLVNNAVSVDFINAVKKCKSVPRELVEFDDYSIIGYYGAIAEWMDFDLLELLLNELQQTKLVLIGPVAPIISHHLIRLADLYSNLIVLPTKTQNELVPFLKRFDVCMIPFVIDNVTKAVSPVKLYEYFGAGKPVVATAMPECRKFDSVYIANNNNHFVNIIKNYLDGKFEFDKSELIKLASDNTWAHRVDLIKSKMLDVSNINIF